MSEGNLALEVFLQRTMKGNAGEHGTRTGKMALGEVLSPERDFSALRLRQEPCLPVYGVFREAD